VTTVAIIPARGGSTRIPRKNLCTLAGIPLIAHTIRAALSAAGVDGVFVSTDDREIAEVAAAHGAEVIWRPARLATAEAPTEPALQHAVTEIEANLVGRPVERIVLLQATSPLRGAARIDEALELMQRTGCDSVVSVVPEIGYYFLGDLGPDQRLRVGYDPMHRLRTQEIPPRYRENGAVYVMTRAQLMERGCRMGRDMRALIMGEDESIDIDTPRELELCRLVLAERARQQTQEQAA
jgi:CMP-N,N'-diacetyllegionaminic acid synthase